MKNVVSFKSLLFILSLFLSAITMSTATATLKEVDAWLQANNYDIYGNPAGTMYMGGSPLFNERTGEATDRFTYLKTKFPELPWESENGKEKKDEMR